MTIHRFYVSNLDADSPSSKLDADQSRQVSRVLRLRQGDEVVVFGGDGLERTAVLDELVERRWRIRLGPACRPCREPSRKIHVGLAAIRNERFDMAVQKLTELGVAGIVPIAAERCVISYGDRAVWEKRRARMQRIAVEAAEQSERTTVPEISDPLPMMDFLKQAELSETCALVERRTADHISQYRPSGRHLGLLIGPEGGWTGAEAEAIADRATPVTLGPLILRSETAAIAAASYLIFSSPTPETVQHD